MTKTTIAELLFMPESSDLRFLPEGPAALGPGVFSWVAIQHSADATIGSLNIYDMTTSTNREYRLSKRPGFAKPTSQEGKFVIGGEHELGIFDIRDESWRLLNDQVDQAVTDTIINDGTVYGNNLIFGTKDLAVSTPKAGLYLYRGSDRRLIQLRDDQTCSNGKDVIDLGGGGLSLIDIDSPTKRVMRYDLDIEAGRLDNPQMVVDLNDLPGVPDGMTMTPDEQSMIISFYNPNPADMGETRQYSLLNGELEHVWKTPLSPQNTCPLLLELPNGSVKLIITTAIEHMPSERQASSPNAGGLFIADTDFKTSPSTPHFPI
jgi:sugar lactone lactonase YvrE